LIDYHDDGAVYHDRQWAALNPPGFLNHYSTTGVEEDKAEMFANLIVDPAHVSRRTKKDRVLKVKAKRMKRLFVAFCPRMNAKFWKRVSELKRSE